ncbi:MAG TPA: SRPBCC domain-containing protein [Candidatus Polarisedimenticolaceae bacterium]|nr:SRPBCC domain-containing protein [Candidatus Polarisedimenticolaceae bacterium]
MSSEAPYNAVVTLTINAPVDEVWKALTEPAQIKQYMHGTTTVSAWKIGSPIFWRGEWEGKQYEDKGVIHAFEPPKLLKFTHWSPMGGSEDKPENYHTVRYELIAEGTRTTLTLTQGNNPSQEAADKMANTAWAPMMQTLKAMLEK